MRSRRRSESLGSIQPAGSRQLGRRSSVCHTSVGTVVGLADGTVAAFADGTVAAFADSPVWRVEGAGSAVTITPFGDGVLVGERGPDGGVRLHDGATGACRWRYETADVVGRAATDSRFRLPFVVDATTTADDSLAFVAGRRAEPDGDARRFHSVVAALRPDGSVAWQFTADASPIALSLHEPDPPTSRPTADAGDNGTTLTTDTQATSDGADSTPTRTTDVGRLAIAYNRTPGDHADGLVVLEAATGEVRRRWDPPGEGSRRVGDVVARANGIFLASHADYRGYRLDADGVAWAVDLGRPVERRDETVYTYPSHVHATAHGAVFCTGNSYPASGRTTDARHPTEQSAVGVAPDGTRRFVDRLGGFTHGITARGNRLAVPVAQSFRDRTPDRHGLRLLDVRTGSLRHVETDGIVTAASLAEERVAFVEEPVSYHDADTTHGDYRLWTDRATDDEE